MSITITAETICSARLDSYAPYSPGDVFEYHDGSGFLIFAPRGMDDAFVQIDIKGYPIHLLHVAPDLRVTRVSLRIQVLRDEEGD